jgi:aryl-alcohol dehydrogenase (NADP+)
MEAEHFPMTRRFGIGNIVWSPLEGGWLAGKYRKGKRNPGDSPRSETWVGDLANPRFARRLDIVEQLVDWAASRNTPLAELAIAWTLRNPDVTSAIIGPRTRAQLDSCVRARDVALSDDEMARIDALVPPGTTVL